jgi:hypothetical protein
LQVENYFAEIPFQHEAYSEKRIETETVGDTQVLVTTFLDFSEEILCFGD